MEIAGLSLSLDSYSRETSNLCETPTTIESNSSMTEPLKITPIGKKEYDSKTIQKSIINNQQNQGVKNNTNEAREKLIHAFRLNRKKQLTLERINKYNIKLMEEIKTPRVKASNCALMVIDYTEQHEDPLIPEIWGVPEKNPFKQPNSKRILQTKNTFNINNDNYLNIPNSSNNKNYMNDDRNGCCIIM